MSDITRYEPLVESVSAVARCGANPGGQYVKYTDHVAEVERLRAEVAALRPDAERYRWLRGDTASDHSKRWTQWEIRCWQAPRWTDDLRCGTLDAAVDTAMAKEPRNE